MVTSEHTAGMVPAVNDIVAGFAVLGAYVTRYGVVAEGVPTTWWHAPLLVTTDLLLPLLGAVWLLAMPTWALYQRVEE